MHNFRASLSEALTKGGVMTITIGLFVSILTTAGAQAAPGPDSPAPAPAPATPADPAAPTEPQPADVVAPTPAPTDVADPQAAAATTAPAAAPAPTATKFATQSDRIPIVVLNLKALSTPPALAETVTGHIAAHLDDLGVFQVLTQNDIQTLVNFDATRISLSDETARSRLTDLGQALGVQYLMFGQLSAVGDNYIVDVVLVDAQATTVLRRESIEPTASNNLLAESNRAVDTVVRGMLDQRRGELFVVSQQEGATLLIDGAAVGTLPMAPIPIGAGPHRIQVQKDLYVAEVLDVTVQPGRRLTKQVVLVPTADWVATYNRNAWLWMAAGGIAASAAVATFAAGFGIWGQQRLEVAGIQADPTTVYGNENRDAIVIKDRDTHTRLMITRVAGYSLMLLSVIPLATSGAIFFFADYPFKYDHLLESAGSQE